MSWGISTAISIKESDTPHGALGLHTPASVHYGTAVEIRAMRADVLDAAYTANPARFRHRRPQPPALPTVAWINDPDKPLTQSA